MAHEFTDANFEEEVLKSAEPVLVDFWAPWCGPCQMMGPIVDQLSQDYQGKKVKIGKVNVDDNNETAAKYSIMSVPTFMVFKGGQPVDQINGGVQKEKLMEIIDRHI